MRYYSFVVFLPHGEIPIPDAHVLLEKGTNTFTCIVKGDVEDFKKQLTAKGARIVQCNSLDEHEPVNSVAETARLMAGHEPIDALAKGDEKALPVDES